ncbi:hypothetical protein LEP1GSC202_3806 [Leptospira yanagawae serovar Saopaulo str. Sao Paulo = ATCC 700523]|uniref:Uncharacterized protein n=1 Tax=Leptospira yanagawae serovar Saopaulo str. Sao Paulo = ATCC 700523 TaxID=1249483 RepID=A0A5E8HJD4_9LEPT|nr:hypothetical protein LEP1GSC202_3806 [Leptospira yanagawae serovar Saopaulo str. Sao Paulo = ATCC 700523]
MLVGLGFGFLTGAPGGNRPLRCQHILCCLRSEARFCSSPPIQVGLSKTLLPMGRNVLVHKTVRFRFVFVSWTLFWIFNWCPRRESPSPLPTHPVLSALRGTVLFVASHPGRLIQNIAPYGSQRFGSQNCSIPDLFLLVGLCFGFLTGAPGGNRPLRCQHILCCLRSEARFCSSPPIQVGLSKTLLPMGRNVLVHKTVRFPICFC